MAACRIQTTVNRLKLTSTTRGKSMATAGAQGSYRLLLPASRRMVWTSRWSERGREDEEETQLTRAADGVKVARSDGGRVV